MNGGEVYPITRWEQMSSVSRLHAACLRDLGAGYRGQAAVRQYSIRKPTRQHSKSCGKVCI